MNTSTGYAFPRWKLQPRRTSLPPAVLLEAGSFSPITNMHLRVAFYPLWPLCLLEQCKDQCQVVEKRYEIVGGFLSPVGDAYGKKGLESAMHRVAMCKEAVKTSDWIEVDTWESEQTEWMPTLRVMRHLKEELKTVYLDTPVAVIIACGTDLVQSFGTPGVWAPEDLRAIFSEFGVACLERDGVSLTRIVFESDAMHAHRHNIISVPQFVPNAISSTAVRLMMRRNLSVKYLVPDAVIAYAERHGLYRDAALETKVGIFEGRSKV